MDQRAIIAAIRDGKEPGKPALVAFAEGLASGAVSDAQAGAFAMAVLCRGLQPKARVTLTRAMRDSGLVLEWDLPGPVLDKHSTGGVGDCVSLLLAPALAACGAYVPMISGRALGHTGGTLDKLEAIPGYRSEVTVEKLRQVVGNYGCAIVAATEDLAPADRRLYAIRDATSTVESLDLITASILSKKLAAGLDGLVLDVKVGSGAFMKTMPEAEALAKALVETAQGAGCMTRALITDMSQPLATAVGNALEVNEVMETLTGVSVNHDLWHLTAELGGELLALGGIAADAEDGAGRIAMVLESGLAAERFGAMVAALGGPSDFVDRWSDRLPSAPVVREVPCTGMGFVRAVDGALLGHCVAGLGGQQERANPAVGLSEIAALGEEMQPGMPLAFIHAMNDADADRAAAMVQAAYHLGGELPPEPPLVHERIG